MRLITSLALAGSLLCATAAFAGWTKSGAAEASFKAKGPGGFKMEGKTTALDVADDGKAVKVVVTLKDLSTGIALRDTHMRDKYLEVAKFPTTTLVVPIASLKIPAAAGAIEGETKGTYTLHGVTKELPFKYKGACGADGVCKVDGEMDVNFKEFGISVPSYLGITVKPDLVVNAAFNVKRP